MSRTSRLCTLLALTGLAAIPFTTLGATPASAEESPRATGSSSEEVRVVHDPGLESSPQVDSTPNLQGCYDGGKEWNAGRPDAEGGDRYIPGWDDEPDSTVGRVPVYVASNRCDDINLTASSEHPDPVTARVCFFPTSSSYYCNDWTTIPAYDTTWHVVATDVVDGTRFEIEFQYPVIAMAGHVAY